MRVAKDDRIRTGVCYWVVVLYVCWSLLQQKDRETVVLQAHHLGSHVRGPELDILSGIRKTQMDAVPWYLVVCLAIICAIALVWVVEYILGRKKQK